MILLRYLALLFITFSAFAEPFENADATIGKALVNQHCIRCHAASFGSDGSAIYTREFRKVKNSNGLATQVRNCNTMLGLKWFEDEELNVSKYLNQQYYKFTE